MRILHWFWSIAHLFTCLSTCQLSYLCQPLPLFICIYMRHTCSLELHITVASLCFPALWAYFILALKSAKYTNYSKHLKMKKMQWIYKKTSGENSGISTMHFNQTKIIAVRLHSTYLWSGIIHIQIKHNITTGCRACNQQRCTAKRSPFS